MEPRNKRGSTTILLVVLVLMGFILMVVLGVSSWTAKLVDEQLSSIDFEVGNISWNETYQQGLKIGLTTMETTVPQIMSVGILLGMILLMLFVSYNIKGKNKLWILVDIIFIIVAEILAWIVSERFLDLAGLTPELLDVFSNTLSQGSKFIINLPLIVPVIGGLMILATYVFSKTKREDVPEF